MQLKFPLMITYQLLSHGSASEAYYYFATLGWFSSLLFIFVFPPEITKVVQPLKGNDDAIRNYGIHQAVEMIRELFNSGYAPGIHIYTLNREVASVAILKKLGMWNNDPSKPLPFKLAADPKRNAEEVRSE